MAKPSENKPKNFLFRELPKGFLIGTASDRYAGWMGKISSKGKYGMGITRRRHKVLGKTFNEETLPVESVTEYFEHFSLLEIHYSFYRPLLELYRNPMQNFHVLRNYRQYMKDGDLVLLKAPQIVIARKLKRGRVVEKSKKGRNRIQNFYKKPKLEIFYPFGTWDPSSPANHLLRS